MKKTKITDTMVARVVTANSMMARMMEWTRKKRATESLCSQASKISREPLPNNEKLALVFYHAGETARFIPK